MNLRRWEFKDNLRISLLEKECFDDPWSLNMLSDTFLQDNFLGYVVTDNGEVIGYIGVMHCLDEAEINLIAVDENYRRKGVALSLLNAVQKELKELGVIKMFLEVRRSNVGAQALYESFGFNYISVRPKYYGNGEDALIMSKIIKE